MSNPKLEITRKDLDAIKSYIASRLATYDVASFDFKMETDEKSGVVNLIQTIKQRARGIFRHALKKCEMIVTIYPGEEIEIGSRSHHKVYLKLQYDHKGGGSNGCDLDIKLRCFDGRVYEVEE